MLSQIYQGYQVTRPKTAAEQREIDRANGELAAAFSAAGRMLGRSLQSSRRARHRDRPALPAVPAVPAPRLPADMECCGTVR